jgi:AraC-like DNA-binding protein
MKIRYEHRERLLNQSFMIHEARLPVFDCTYHVHEEMELIYLMGSHGTRLIDGWMERYSPGEILLIGSKVPHAFFNRLRDSKGPEWTRYICIQFKPDFLGQTISDRPEFHSIANWLSQFRGSSQAKGKLNARLRQLIPEMLTAEPFECLLAFLRILHLLSVKSDEMRPTHGESYEPPLQPFEIERLDRVIGFVRRHYAETIPLERIAAEAHMAPTSFSRFFHQKMGRTFREFLLEIRIYEVCTRLLTSKDPVIQIALDCGFQNLSNFNRQFRRIKEVSPSEFRRRWHL